MRYFQELFNELIALRQMQLELQQLYTLLRLMRVDLEKIIGNFTSLSGKYFLFSFIFVELC